MTWYRLPATLFLLTAGWLAAHGGVLTVTTADNAMPPPGALSLAQALTSLRPGDEVRFNIAGPGPHYLATPRGGYPRITASNIRIDGYSQPGSAPNTNTILAPNSAQLRIVLDSRNGQFTSMDYDPGNPHAGYGPREFAILGIQSATNVTIRGLCLLGTVPQPGDPSRYGIAFAADAQGSAGGGHVAGCWIGVDPDGHTVSGTHFAITAFRHRDRLGGNPVLVSDLTVGVARGSTAPRAEFNVIVQTALPIIAEGNRLRVSGNFLGVMPDGMRDYNVAFDPAYYGEFQGEAAIEVGRAGNGTVIGVDGDGVNDAEERNVIGGTVPLEMNGYPHTLEFYDNLPGTNIVIAGNYLGIAIDGSTRFTNGVPAVNAGGATSRYRLGSDFDGVSDALEGNVIANHWSADLFPGDSYLAWLAPERLNFHDELAIGGGVALRGNRLINNLPFPAGPGRSDGLRSGQWRTNYYARALVDPAAGIEPVMNTSSTVTRLIGTVPVADRQRFPATVVDLYTADPDGLVTGLSTDLPDLPRGFVQGRTYVASFVENGPLDLNPIAGEFEFDLTFIYLPDRVVTATANYVGTGTPAASAETLTSPFSAPVLLAGEKPPKLKITQVGGQVHLAWPPELTGFTLEYKARLSDPAWLPLGRQNPTPIGIGRGPRFYRIRK